MGNLTNIDYPSQTDVRAGYDADNRLVSLTDGLGTTTFGWNELGALASENGPWAEDTVSYSYDGSGLRSALSLAQPNGVAWSQSYGYDASWRLSGVTSAAGASTTPTWVRAGCWSS